MESGRRMGIIDIMQLKIGGIEKALHINQDFMININKINDDLF